MYSEIKNCRICKSKDLQTILSLGEQYLTGVFPKSKEIGEKVSKGPLDLVRCSCCGLLQMRQSYILSEMYGHNYGYRSCLNSSMVSHLDSKIKALEKFAKPQENDLVVDIGSNDATSLKAYSIDCVKVGIDPVGVKFKECYNNEIILIPDFFSANKFFESFPNKRAKIITSIAMFYDLDEPAKFVEDIEKCLADDGNGISNRVICRQC